MIQEIEGSVRLPFLFVGKVYHRAEVEEYIARQADTNDYNVAVSGFPRKRPGSDYPNTKLFFAGQGKEIVMEYALIDIDRFRVVLERLNHNYARNPADQMKVHTIKGLLERASPAFPVWIERHLVNCDPLGISEGNHRLVAFADLGMRRVPVFLLKYDGLGS